MVHFGHRRLTSLASGSARVNGCEVRGLHLGGSQSAPASRETPYSGAPHGLSSYPEHVAHAGQQIVLPRLSRPQLSGQSYCFVAGPTNGSCVHAATAIAATATDENRSAYFKPTLQSLA